MATVKLQDIAVGELVQVLRKDGGTNQFRVVHKGNPDPSIYDDTCEGVWLLSEDSDYQLTLDINFRWGTNHYADTAIHAYFAGEYLEQFPQSVVSAFKTVNIPCIYSTRYGSNDTFTTLNTKAFALSAIETGDNADDYNYNGVVDGKKLDWFESYSATDELKSDKLKYPFRWYTRTFAHVSISIYIYIQ